MKFYMRHPESVDAEICGIYEQPQEIVKYVFYGKEKELSVIPSMDLTQPSKIFIGLGKKEKLTVSTLRNLYAMAQKEVIKLKARSVLVRPLDTELPEAEVLKAMAEGMGLADYQFEQYKTEKKPHSNCSVYFAGIKDDLNGKEILEQVSHLTDSINWARNLILEPSNRLNPEILAERTSKIAKESGFEIEVLGEEEIEILGMEAYLMVGKGSVNRPKLLVMRYMNGGSDPVTGLVGKGLTCDTGGYSLKNSQSLMYMKGDMAGAANVIAVMSALAKNHCRVNVKAVVAACENVLSGSSYKPGDVVTAMSGKSIEVLNTDAEGRLTLADAICYMVRREKADRIIDMATLTGMAGQTFGSLYTPVFSNDEEFFQAFMKAASRAGEDFWRMPCDERYHSYIESEIADIKNTGDAGTITAAIFLNDFTDNIPWIHLDIAATAQQYPTVYEYASGCPSGVAVRTIYTLLSESNFTKVEG